MLNINERNVKPASAHPVQRQRGHVQIETTRAGIQVKQIIKNSTITMTVPSIADDNTVEQTGKTLGSSSYCKTKKDSSVVDLIS